MFSVSVGLVDNVLECCEGEAITKVLETIRFQTTQLGHRALVFEKRLERIEAHPDQLRWGGFAVSPAEIVLRTAELSAMDHEIRALTAIIEQYELRYIDLGGQKEAA